MSSSGQIPKRNNANGTAKKDKRLRAFVRFNSSASGIAYGTNASNILYRSVKNYHQVDDSHKHQRPSPIRLSDNSCLRPAVLYWAHQVAMYDWLDNGKIVWYNINMFWQNNSRNIISINSRGNRRLGKFNFFSYFSSYTRMYRGSCRKVYLRVEAHSIIFTKA